MTLHDYAQLKDSKSDGALAKEVGCTRGYITMLRLAIRKHPSLSLALKIERATNGKVPVGAWGLA